MEKAINAVIRQYLKNPQVSDFRARAGGFYAEAEPWTNLISGRQFLMIDVWSGEYGEKRVFNTQFWKI